MACEKQKNRTGNNTQPCDACGACKERQQLLKKMNLIVKQQKKDTSDD